MKLHSNSWLYNPIVGNGLSWFLGLIILYPYVNGYTDNEGFVITAVTVAPIWTIWLHAYRQAIKIEIKKKEINHTVSFLVRAIVAVIAGVLIHLLAEQNAPGCIVRGFIAAIYMGAIFWATFDFFINHHRGKPWDYIDQGKVASNSDKIFREEKTWWITTKGLIFIFAFLLYKWSFTWYI